jgi:hypothetical protein
MSKQLIVNHLNVYSMENTGIKKYSVLIEINDRTGLPTGRTKPNVPTDPDYIAPIEDLNACPIDENQEFSREFSHEFLIQHQ